MESQTQKRTTNRKEPRITLVKTISDFCGKDKRALMFKNVKGKLHLFIIDTKAEGKIPLKHQPKSYIVSDTEPLGVFLYNLSKEQKQKRK